MLVYQIERKLVKLIIWELYPCLLVNNTLRVSDT